MVSEWSSFVNEAREEGYNPDDFEPVYVLKSSDLCFAFNKNISDETINRFNNSLEKLKSDGTINNIFQKYKDVIYQY